jgi:transcriptional regulator with XRE-family HTH domain
MVLSTDNLTEGSMRKSETPQGQRIRKARNTLGLTQAQVAEAVGVCAVTVSLWEIGSRRPSLAHAVALQAALGIEGLETCEPSRKGRRRPYHGCPVVDASGAELGSYAGMKDGSMIVITDGVPF